MSKKIRVGWDDLKPGDLIHVKGSTNTYRFKSRTDWHSMIKVEGDGVGVSATWKLGVEKEPVSVFLVVYEEDFAYATRPAPKKKPRPSIVEPILPGEYWARIFSCIIGPTFFFTRGNRPSISTGHALVPIDWGKHP